MNTAQLLRRLTPLTMAILVGCGRSTPPSEPAALAPVIAPPATDEVRGPELAQTPTQPTQPLKPPAGPPVVLPADTGGKAVAKALMLPTPLPQQPPSGIKSAPDSSAIDRGELPLPSVTPRPFSRLEPNSSAVKPSSPAEKQLPATQFVTLPESQGSGRPLVKAPALPDSRAADVPMNAWRQGDRAPLEDPTVELSAGRVIETPLPLNTAGLPFLRLTIPNPFELSEQLKGKLGKDVELGQSPPK
jgi:hypothetical protein